jgi:hypothetical protein
MSTVRLAAPYYVVMAGASAGEGAVLARTQTGVAGPGVLRLGNGSASTFGRPHGPPLACNASAQMQPCKALPHPFSTVTTISHVFVLASEPPHLHALSAPRGVLA